MLRQRTPPKEKRIEDVYTILNRVERANCCLQPKYPERFDVMAKAVGDGSEYFQNPTSRAHYIRYKFLQNNFLQGVQEDFMSCQNIERVIDSVIDQGPELFRQHEITNPEE